MKPRAVVGVGVASPFGVGVRSFFEAIARGGDRLPAVEVLEGPISGRATFDVKKYAGARLAEVPAFDPAKYLGDKGLRTLDRLTKLLVVATRLALEDAGLKVGGAWNAAADGARPWPDRAGLVVSNAYGSLEAITELDRVALLEDARYINPSRFPLTVSNSAAGYASIWEDLRALNVTVSDGNCGALDAVACADLLLENDRADVLLVGGAEALCEALVVAFHRLRLGSPGADAGPAFLGEGAALVALERSDRARARGANARAEVVGYGTSFAAPEAAGALVHATPDALQRAIEGALADAGVARGDVDLVVCGVSGVRAFDDAELTALRRTVGDGACIVAPKLAMGETLGAGGAMAMLVALALFDRERSASDGAAAPNLGAMRVRGSLRAGVRNALVTSMGYYGNASALVMRPRSE